jgi:hypothetical protein
MDKRKRRKGIILAADDLRPGLLIAIHHWRDGREYQLGIAHRLRVIQLPYVVAQPLHNPDAKPVTLDVRKVRFMAVSEDYAQAQGQGTEIPPAHPDSEIPF